MRNELEEELNRTHKEFEKFAYVVSHDLQEPVWSISCFLELLQEHSEEMLDEKADEYLGYALAASNQLQDLIDGLLGYSRVITQTQPLARTECEAIVRKAQVQLQPQIRESNAKITHDPLPEVWADREQLLQVFIHLITNAIKFRGESPPEIHISARQESGEWMFSVRDNGIGIEAEFFERIFEMFQRLYPSSDYPGGGMGLTISKKIVERHGGAIWVDSQIKKGSIFYFTLPEAQRGRGNGALS